MCPPALSDTWESGDPYEQYVGRWSRRVAAPFLSWLDRPQGGDWLDIGCGTGALCASILDHCSPRSVTGVDTSEGFLRTAQSSLGKRAAFHVGSAMELPHGAAEFDNVVSGLVLNFVAEPLVAVTEMARVTRKGGTIGVYVWDYSGKMEMLRIFWDCACELDQQAAAFDEGRRFPLCDPDELRRLFDDAGLAKVRTTALDIESRFVNFDDYWLPFLGGQGPAPAYVKSLSESDRALLQERIRNRLAERADGSILLNARAWAICATVKDGGWH